MENHRSGIGNRFEMEKEKINLFFEIYKYIFVSIVNLYLNIYISWIYFQNNE